MHYRFFKHLMVKRKYRFSIILSTLGLLMVFLLLPQMPCFSQAARDKEKLQRTKQQLEEEIRYTTDLLEKTKQNKQTNK